MKNNLLKVIGITFLISIVLSILIPASYIGETDTITRLSVGLYNLFLIPITTLTYFSEYGIFFLILGGLYGVLTKLHIINIIVDKFKDTKKLIFYITLGFILTSAFIGIPSLSVVVAPLFCMVLLKLGYSKLSTFGATFGAMLVGQICSVTGTTPSIIEKTFQISVTENILEKLVILVVFTGIYLLFFKVEKNTEEVVFYNTEKTNQDISLLPFIVVSSIIIVYLIIGIFDLPGIFNITIFAEMYENVFTLLSDAATTTPLFYNIFGPITTPGTWNNYQVMSTMITASMLIAWLYNMKVKDYCNAFIEGSKKLIPTALIAAMSFIILVQLIMLSSVISDANYANTLFNYFMMTDSASVFNIFSSNFIITLLYSDANTVVQNFGPVYTSLNVIKNLPITALLLQLSSGLVMLIAPTSMYLMAGLAFTEVSYKEWMKFVWKFTVAAVIFSIIITTIITIL